MPTPVREPTRITIGNVPTLSFSIDVGGTPADPDSLQLIIRSESDVLGPYVYETDEEIVRDAAGEYHADIIPAQLGRYAWRWEAFDASSQPMAASEGEFLVVSLL